MRAVVQRVKQARVLIENQWVTGIEKGLLVYLGIGINDTDEMIPKMAEKLLHLRIFDDQDGKMNLNVLESKGAMLVVSQFTLYGDTKKGNRPSFIEAMPLIEAKKYYLEMVDYLMKHIDTKQGIFGADMDIDAVNDGPVTIIHEI